MLYKTKTLGSIMIMGEHSVLHSHPSIAASIDKYIYVTVKKNNLRKIHINSDYFGKYETYISQIKPSKDFDIILAVLEKYREFLSEGIDVEVKSDFSPEFGLGSSTAVLVGVISSLMLMLKRKITKQELLLEAITILKKIRGAASGSDIAASIYEGVIYFDPRSYVVERIADYLPIIVAYSGYKTKTEDVIKKINFESQDHHLDIDDIYLKNGNLTKEAAIAIRNKDYVKLGMIMKFSNDILYKQLNLVTDELQDILEKFKKEKSIYGAKISGAGLGDCAIALSKNTKSCVFMDMQTLPVSIASNFINKISITEDEVGLKKIDIVKKILGNKLYNKSSKRSATAFAPSNIAICKYWGKRNEELHLPVNSSLSISLNNLGSKTTISLAEEDKVELNGHILNSSDQFASKIFDFINLFRQQNNFKLFVKIQSNIPIAAGLASSAAGFAALTLVLNNFFDWQLNTKELSILARLGSGSAARSIERGFIKWHKGSREDGMDSYTEKLLLNWSDLCCGILIVSKQEKHISSRDAMKITKETSPLFKTWSNKAMQDIHLLISAIKRKNFVQFGEILEANSNSMHKMMATSSPSLIYKNSSTEKLISKIKSCRTKMEIPVFYTQDAGPNLVIFFEKKNFLKVKTFFSNEAMICEPV
ncbi:MAG: diphosphomevalonate decarboxylase [Rickettsiales bacterium]|nr:diphosphomevalonate decarboxylase [Rickettsiales bacterium]